MGKQREGFEKATESYFHFHPQEVMEGPANKKGNPLKIGLEVGLTFQMNTIILILGT